MIWLLSPIFLPVGGSGMIRHYVTTKSHLHVINKTNFEFLFNSLIPRIVFWMQTRWEMWCHDITNIVEIDTVRIKKQKMLLSEVLTQTVIRVINQSRLIKCTKLMNAKRNALAFKWSKWVRLEHWGGTCLGNQVWQTNKII